MLKNVLSFSLRSIRKKWRLYTFNILSLAICAAALHLAFYIYHSETQVNKIFSRSERTYRISTKAKFDNSEQQLATTLSFIGQYLFEEIPAIETYTQFVDSPKNTFKIDGTEIESKILEVDSNFFSVFDFRNVDNVRVRHHDAVASQELLARLGGKSALDKNIEFNNGLLAVVEAVDQSGTDFRYDLFAPMTPRNEFDWVHTYIVLKPSFSNDSKELEEIINRLLAERLSGEFDNETMSLRFQLENLEDLHFEKKMYDNKVTFSKNVIVLLVVITVTLFLLASLNHITLFGSVKGSSRNEMFVRRVFGATKSNVMLFFIFESAIIYVIGFSISVLLIWGVGLYTILGIANVPFSLASFSQLLLAYIILGAASGFMVTLIHYKGIFSPRESAGNKTYKSLLIVQLSLALIAIVTHISITKQLRLVRNFDLGFELENVLAIRADKSSVYALRDRLASNSNVVSVALCEFNSLPGNEPEVQLWKNRKTGAGGYAAMLCYVDSSYFNVLNIRHEIATEFNEDKIVVNEAMMLERNVSISDVLNMKEVVGFAENTLNRGFYHSQQPQVYAYDTSKFNSIILKYKNDPHDIRRFVESSGDILQNTKVEVISLNDLYFNEYQQFYKISEIIALISLSVLFVSLFGLYSTGKLLYALHLKEYSVRFILGSTISEYRWLHTLRLLKLVGIAMVIAIPSAMFASSFWLKEFVIKAYLSGLELVGIAAAFLALSLITSILIVSFSKFHPIKVLNSVLRNG